MLNDFTHKIGIERPPYLHLHLGHGEAASFKFQLFNKGIPVEISEGYTAKFWYRKLRSQDQWYLIDGTISDSIITINWDNNKDDGTNELEWYIQVKNETDVAYRILGDLILSKTPGFTPVSVPIPPQVLDWATFENENIDSAPFMKKGEIPPQVQSDMKQNDSSLSDFIKNKMFTFDDENNSWIYYCNGNMFAIGDIVENNIETYLYNDTESYGNVTISDANLYVSDIYPSNNCSIRFNFGSDSKSGCISIYDRREDAELITIDIYGLHFTDYADIGIVGGFHDVKSLEANHLTARSCDNPSEEWGLKVSDVYQYCDQGICFHNPVHFCNSCFTFKSSDNSEHNSGQIVLTNPCTSQIINAPSLEICGSKQMEYFRLSNRYNAISKRTILENVSYGNGQEQNTMKADIQLSTQQLDDASWTQGIINGMNQCAGRARYALEIPVDSSRIRTYCKEIAIKDDLNAYATCQWVTDQIGDINTMLNKTRNGGF